MNLLPWFRALQDTPVGATIRNSPVLFPICMTGHLIGLAMLVGSILITDLGLLGFGMRRQPVSEIAGQLSRWTLAGAALVVFSGAFLFTARAVRCYRNPYFHLKMLLLVIASIYHFTIHRRMTLPEAAAAKAARRWLVASISLALWIGAGFVGEIFTVF